MTFRTMILSKMALIEMTFRRKTMRIMIIVILTRSIMTFGTSKNYIEKNNLSNLT
jgi:hypothetical protein